MDIEEAVTYAISDKLTLNW